MSCSSLDSRRNEKQVLRFMIHNSQFTIRPLHSIAHRGLTLIETLVVIAIFTIAMSAIISSVIFFYRANTSSLEQSYQIASARRGIEFLVRDLREATYGDNGAYPLAVIASTSVAFYSDTDKDSVTERIRYTLLGNMLYRNVLDSSGTPPTYTGSGATSTVSQYVRNNENTTPIFRYYDGSGNEIINYTEVDEVRFVTVELVVNIQPVRAPGEFSLRSSATLRNVRR